MAHAARKGGNPGANQRSTAEAKASSQTHVLFHLH